MYWPIFCYPYFLVKSKLNDNLSSIKNLSNKNLCKNLNTAALLKFLLVTVSKYRSTKFYKKNHKVLTRRNSLGRVCFDILWVGSDRNFSLSRVTCSSFQHFLICSRSKTTRYSSLFYAFRVMAQVKRKISHNVPWKSMRFRFLKILTNRPLVSVICVDWVWPIRGSHGSIPIDCD